MLVEERLSKNDGSFDIVHKGKKLRGVVFSLLLRLTKEVGIET